MCHETGERTFLSTSPKEARYARHYCLRYVFRERLQRKVEAQVFRPRSPARKRGRADQFLGRRSHPGAQNGVGMTLTASQAEWLRVRSYLQEHRYALAVD